MQGICVVAFDDNGFQVDVGHTECCNCGRDNTVLYVSLDINVYADGDGEMTATSSSDCCDHHCTGVMNPIVAAQVLEHLTSCPGHADMRREDAALRP